MAHVHTHLVPASTSDSHAYTNRTADKNVLAFASAKLDGHAATERHNHAHPDEHLDPYGYSVGNCDPLVHGNAIGHGNALGNLES
ncbi:MAG: hypothetical protein N3C12_01140 [Candidatus Binatia bacterium]|nr:hypothetical protein [Candidatus Binatia bacterium]